MVDEDTLLIVFSNNVVLNGLAVTAQDIVQFDATSLGSTTAGTFSMYFNGADVGLDDATTEKIDAMGILPDGRILISTAGNPIVPGVTTAKDEDLLALSPNTLGDNTSGSWELYFDGSNVGLAETTSEDLDAASVVGENIYLSTTGDFAVNGVAGAGEDVFVCAVSALGTGTTCSYSSTLFFDGSAWGLVGNSLDALYVQTANLGLRSAAVSSADNLLPSAYTPASLPTPTPTATEPPTSTPTPTTIPSAMSVDTQLSTPAIDGGIPEPAPETIN
jgi:hypothetical protein